MATFRGLLAPLPMVAAAAGLLLLPAGLFCGVWVWPRAWIMLAAFGVASCGASAVLAVVSPASFMVRRQGIVAAPEKRQPLIDAVGLGIYAAYMAAWFAFIPLDVLRFRLLPAPPSAVEAAGGAALIAGVVVSYVAIGQNRFAAPTIHDQSGDGQHVIDRGLYSVVRHPFYAGMLVIYAGWALWLGSYAALIGASGFLVMTLMRIVIEEAWLRKALPAYGDYARRVRSRLIPYVL
ncbi:MAG TPA: isoprenylcysteine carboxylmethyltransferase family protein [Phenylobacterium sp.]